MASLQKVFDAVLSGRSDTNVRFNDLRRIAHALGFVERIKGGHYIYSREGVTEILNFQPRSGGGAKPYQVKQLRQLIAKYGFTL